ncbi:MAG: hypothetical protein GQ538_08830 [Xanthomonadales bacterium]|nr:hypothetical protein [Xanthomonadales bacterium]
MPVIEYFPYFGPNRRSDKPVVEITLNTVPGDNQCSPQNLSRIKALLESGGVLKPGEQFPEQALPAESLACHASLLVQTALLFQRKAGHRVDFFSVFIVPNQEQCIALLEHEHCDVGMMAVKLADELISGKRKTLTEPFRLFCEFAHERLLPLETEAIIKAAGQRDIPCFQLERHPFSRDKNMPVCVRRNGLLMLGHGPHAHVLDGTFCLDKSGDRLNALLRNRSQRRAVLEGLGLPVVTNGDSSKTGEDMIHIFVINGQVTAVLAVSVGRMGAVENLHASLIDLSIAVNREVEGFPIVVSLLTGDVSQPLAQSGGCVVDFELGPDLERLTDQRSELGSQLFDRTVEALLGWLFPGNGSARIPIIAVTGTNGKTTTTRMISHVMMAAGHKPGMVCTDGIYSNGRRVSNYDAGSLFGHADLLTLRGIDVAVLESHHRGILIRGFTFNWCDVAVCLNVTDDHLDEANIRSVKEMAVVKRALLERARYAAILNADDEQCLKMLDYMVADKVCLVSMLSSKDNLSAHRSKGHLCFCVLESVDGHDWVVIYDRVRLPVMPVTSMPASFDGLALFNVSNAMHAIAASYMVGVNLKDIRSGMGDFNMSFETTPGRLNFYDGHPFRVLMDYAHNTDGMRQLSKFVGQLEVRGKKILMLQARGDIETKYVKGIATAAAGDYDHFVCRAHPLYPGTDKHRTPAVLKDTLMKAGVGEHQITVTTNPIFAVDTMLKMGTKGDLLVFTPGSGQPRLDNWKQIISFKSETDSQE